MNKEVLLSKVILLFEENKIKYNFKSVNDLVFYYMTNELRYRLYYEFDIGRKIKMYICEIDREFINNSQFKNALNKVANEFPVLMLLFGRKGWWDSPLIVGNTICFVNADIITNPNRLIEIVNDLLKNEENNSDTIT